MKKKYVAFSFAAIVLIAVLAVLFCSSRTGQENIEAPTQQTQPSSEPLPVFPQQTPASSEPVGTVGEQPPTSQEQPVFGGPQAGGFRGPAAGLFSVAQVKELRDDAWVSLEGSIVRRIGHELYEFRDNSGSIIIDIDDKRWMGQQVTPNNIVHIDGEIDRDWNGIEIEVKTVRVIK